MKMAMGMVSAAPAQTVAKVWLRKLPTLMTATRALRSRPIQSHSVRRHMMMAAMRKARLVTAFSGSDQKVKSVLSQ